MLLKFKYDIKMYKTFLTCKYEPDWTPFSIGEHSRCNGECKFPLPKLISLKL